MNMRRTEFLIVAISCLGFIKPLWAQCLPSQPCLRLKAVSVNGQAITATNDVTIQPGATVVAELTLSDWNPVLQSLQTFQATLLGAMGVQSGDTGYVLPAGWDAPLVKDRCPCKDSNYPICDPFYGCVGADHDPEKMASIQLDRPDYVFAGHPVFAAVAVDSLDIKWGSTINGPDGVMDVHGPRYAGTLSLFSTLDAQGSFEFGFVSNINLTFFAGPEIIAQTVEPRWEGLSVRVECDDGTFCNGLESHTANSGCTPGLPPNCDDGVACTIDSCDEISDGCVHSLNHVDCDDGDFCTRDECTPEGCTHIDEQCGAVPAASHWGLLALTLALLIGAKARFRPRLA